MCELFYLHYLLTASNLATYHHPVSIYNTRELPCCDMWRLTGPILRVMPSPGTAHCPLLSALVWEVVSSISEWDIILLPKKFYNIIGPEWYRNYKTFME